MARGGLELRLGVLGGAGELRLQLEQALREARHAGERRLRALRADAALRARVELGEDGLLLRRHFRASGGTFNES